MARMSRREEANAIVMSAFRNNSGLEDLHAECPVFTDARMKHNTKNISGERFGRLVVLRQGDLRVYKNGLKRGRGCACATAGKSTPQPAWLCGGAALRVVGVSDENGLGPQRPGTERPG